MISFRVWNMPAFGVMVIVLVMVPIIVVENHVFGGVNFSKKVKRNVGKGQDC